MIVLATVVLFLLFYCVFVGLLVAWPVMLMVGALHSYLPQVPALGFVPVLLIVLIIRFVFPGGNANTELNKQVKAVRR